MKDDRNEDGLHIIGGNLSTGGMGVFVCRFNPFESIKIEDWAHRTSILF